LRQATFVAESCAMPSFPVPGVKRTATLRRRAGEIITSQKVISILHSLSDAPVAIRCSDGYQRPLRYVFLRLSINVSARLADMTQMSGYETETESGREAPGRGPFQNFALALELLRGCGMILRVRLLRTSPTDGRCHPVDRDLRSPLSSRVHPSSVIWCNGLNLSRGSRV
jgi:hypothetical protein